MPEAFLNLPAADQAEILQTCAGQLGKRPEHLEKDVWICWVLQGLFNMPGRLPMAFKGGTSLSKVYEVIRRFSEDVDVTVDYKSLDQSIDPFDAQVTRSAQSKFTAILKTKLADHTKNVIRPHFERLVGTLKERPSKPIPSLMMGRSCSYLIRRDSEQTKAFYSNLADETLLHQTRTILLGPTLLQSSQISYIQKLQFRF